jgi:hypothetical protein
LGERTFNKTYEQWFVIIAISTRVDALIRNTATNLQQRNAPIARIVFVMIACVIASGKIMVFLENLCNNIAFAQRRKSKKNKKSTNRLLGSFLSAMLKKAMTKLNNFFKFTRMYKKYLFIT